MNYLNENALNFKPYNYIELDMSNKDGHYSAYYLNNVEKNYTKLNMHDNDSFIFGLSNSNLNKPFKKVINYKRL